MKKDLPVIAFTSTAAMRSWLVKHHTKSEGVLLRIFKKDSGEATVTYAEALDEALCFGWIDGVKNALDARSWLQRFTPRRARSSWSKRNTEHVARLIAAGRMTPAGQAQIDAAKADGRWARAYDAQSSAVIPEDFLKQLSKDKKAKAFFDTLNKANRFAIAYRLQTAKKPETREKRMVAILAMMKKGETFHP